MKGVIEAMVTKARRGAYRSFATRSLESKYIGQFCVIVAGLLLLILAVGQVTARIDTVQSIFTVGSALIMLTFALLFWTLRARRLGFAADSRSEPGMSQVPDIEDPQLRDRYIMLTGLSRLGLIELDQQSMISVLFDFLPSEPIPIAAAELKPTKQILRGVAAANDREDRHSTNRAGGSSPASVDSFVDQWVDSVLNRVDVLKNLPDGWLNGEGKPLSPHVLTLGYAIGSRLSVVIPEPVGIFPTVEGGMQFEWTRASGSLVTIQILPDLRIEVAETAEDEEESKQQIVSGRDIVNFVREIAETVG